MTRRLPVAIGLVALLLGAVASGGGDGSGDGGGALAPSTPVAEVKTAVEGAAGVSLSEAAVPEAAAKAGVAALLVTGDQPQNGQRILVAIGGGGTPNAIDEGLKAELGTLVGWTLRLAAHPRDSAASSSAGRTPRSS
jgi:hypothetical protein